MIIDDIIVAVNDADFDIDFKGVFTVSKALFTSFGIYKAKRSGDAKPAVRLLGFNALLVALITIYKLTRREIAPLFVLQCLSHYSCFLVFAALAGFGSHPKIKKGKRGDRRIALAIWTLHLLYAIVLVLGFLWAECYEGHVYPVSFLMSDTLFLVSYVMLLYTKKRGFDVESLMDDAEDDATKEDLELFNAQIDAFFSQQRILVVWHFVEMVLGYVLFNVLFEDAVTCDESGDAWVFNFKAGKLFLLLHTYGVKQGLGVASKVFFKTVKKLDKKRKMEAKEKGE
eukprot:CAMPEP_0178668288 /NCGR_PEP_ID=MMETSP0698-20121128/31502_1 /TAXON_ID=265572 /ORGANISM="Extubocellulus spinifer, Strain CCMP396" /LENGTH=283 /DNA_ID=CAMNT_0020311849 /DNA_START=241 /DNA_END=1093 /DNA_ORIENTATION=-